MNKLRIGVIGPGSIFRRVMADADRLENSVFAAVASSSLERAEAASREYGIENAFGSYEEMAKSDKVDLIYIATPHNFHKAQAIMCMENGKHVIVEKPAALNRAEWSEMTACAKKNGVFLMEAMWTRLLPAIRDISRRADAGEFGELRHISADFAFNCPEDPASRLYSMKLAGGSLLDVGVYDIAVAQHFAGTKASAVQSVCRKATTGADAEMSLQAVYPDGVTAHLFCGIDVDTPNDMDLYYTGAHIHIPGFWHAEGYTVYRGGDAETVAFRKEHEGHHYEFDHAAWCIANGLAESPVLTHEESMNVIAQTEEIRLRHGIRYPEEM